MRNCVSVACPSWYIAIDTILHTASRTKPIIFDVQHDTSHIDGKHTIIQSQGRLISRLVTSAWKGYKVRKGKHTLTNMLNFCHTGFIYCGILWEFKQTLRTPSNKNLLLDTILMAIQLHTMRDQAFYEKSIRNCVSVAFLSWYFAFGKLRQDALALGLRYICRVLCAHEEVEIIGWCITK